MPIKSWQGKSVQLSTLSVAIRTPDWLLMYSARTLLQISVNQSTAFLLKVLDVMVALNFE